MDSYEIIPIDSVTAKSTVIYKADGTGAKMFGSLVIDEFTWELTENNTILKTVFPNAWGADTDLQHIDKITSSSMVLKDVSGGSVFWLIYVKQ